VLDLVGPEHTPALKEAASERCSIHKLAFSEEFTIVGVQDVNQVKLDNECVQLALGAFLSSDPEKILEFEGL